MDSALEAMTIPAMVVAACTAHAERDAVVEDGHAMTYAELGDAVRAAAASLVAATVQRGDRVAIWAPNTTEWIVAALASAWVGATLVPLNTRYRGREAADLLLRSQARILFTVTGFLDTNYVDLLTSVEGLSLPDLQQIVLLRGEAQGPVVIGGMQVPVLTWAALLAFGDQIGDGEVDARGSQVRSDDISDIMFTSGTTGRSKGVMVSHEQTLRTFRTWSELVGLRADDRYLVVNPFFHTFGWKAGVLAALMRGAAIVPHPVFDPAEVLARIPQDRITMLPGPPALYQSILGHLDGGGAATDISSLRLAVTGAASIPVSLIERMTRDLGFDSVLTAYGLTESTGVVSMCRDGDDAVTIATTSGCAIPGTQIRTVDEVGQDVGVGQHGEVWFRGPNVMIGYLDDEEATAATVTHDGWLRTGDIGVLDERGYLDIVDRVKDMFIVGGFNVYPAEVENDLLEHPAIARAAVVGMADERLGEVGCAFVVPTPGMTVDVDEIIAWCRERFANFKVPRQIEVVEDLPANASAKVDKLALRASITP